jgi:hypothetical protein
MVTQLDMSLTMMGALPVKLIRTERRLAIAMMIAAGSPILINLEHFPTPALAMQFQPMA